MKELSRNIKQEKFESKNSILASWKVGTIILIKSLKMTKFRILLYENYWKFRKLLLMKKREKGPKSMNPKSDFENLYLLDSDSFASEGVILCQGALYGDRQWRVENFTYFEFKHKIENTEN